MSKQTQTAKPIEIRERTNTDKPFAKTRAQEVEKGQAVHFENEDGNTRRGVVLRVLKAAVVVESVEHEPKRYKLAEGVFRSLGEQAETIRRYRDRYETSVTASGRKSLNNGDDVAVVLEAKEAEFVMALADHVLGLEAGSTARRYAHLNQGQKRMNAGNKIRAAVKRGDVTIDDLKAAQIEIQSAE